MKFFRIKKMLASCSVLFLLLIVFLISADAADNLKTIKVTRITPPAFEMNNYFAQTLWIDLPWSGDFDKILLFESKKIDSGGGYTQGRGTVWARISDLKAAVNWNDLDKWRDDYIKVTNALDYRLQDNRRAIHWSPYSGEEDILYIVNKDRKLVKYNVVTGNIQVLTSALEVGGNPYIRGFTTDQKVVVSIEGKYGDKLKVDRNTGSIGSGGSVPDTGNTHRSDSPDGIWMGSLHGSSDKDDCPIKYPDSKTCTGVFNKNTGKFWGFSNNIYKVTHSNWVVSNDYFIGGTLPDKGVGWTPKSPNKDATWYIVQVHWDKDEHSFTNNVLYEYKSATYWDDDGSGPNGFNYMAMPSPSQRKDGRQIYFPATSEFNTATGKWEGRYTYDDYRERSTKPYSPVGGFLLDLVSESEETPVSEDAPVSEVTPCTSYTYSAWKECGSDNTQTRTITSSSPAGCTIDNPILVQECSFVSKDDNNKILQVLDSPTIDGDLAEFTLANFLSLSPSTGGNSVIVKMLWNSDALYLGFLVSDTHLNASATNRDGSVWKDDAIEWFIDTNNDEGGSSDPNTLFMLADDYHGIINILNTQYDSQGNASGMPSSSWNGNWHSAIKLNGTINDNTDDDTGYTMEVKIPWTSIGYSSAPAVDSIIGLSVVIDDKDDSDYSTLMLAGVTNAYENASQWQKFSITDLTVSADLVSPAPPTGLIIE